MIEDILSPAEDPDGGLFIGIAVALAVEAAVLLMVWGYFALAAWVEGR